MKVVLLIGSKSDIRISYDGIYGEIATHNENVKQANNAIYCLAFLDEKNVFSHSLRDLSASGLQMSFVDGNLVFSDDVPIFKLENRIDGACRLVVTGAAIDRLPAIPSLDLKGSRFEPRSVEEWDELWSSLRRLIDTSWVKASTSVGSGSGQSVTRNEFAFDNPEELLEQLKA